MLLGSTESPPRAGSGTAHRRSGILSKTILQSCSLQDTACSLWDPPRYPDQKNRSDDTFDPRTVLGLPLVFDGHRYWCCILVAAHKHCARTTWLRRKAWNISNAVSLRLLPSFQHGKVLTMVWQPQQQRRRGRSSSSHCGGDYVGRRGTGGITTSPACTRHHV